MLKRKGDFKKKRGPRPVNTMDVPFIPSPLYDQIRLVDETDDYWVWEKPAGLLVEKSAIFPSLESYVFKKDRAERKKPFVGVVHRIDRPVSGLVIMAKKKSILKMLNERFRDQKINKTYLALVQPCPPKLEDTIENWISKDAKTKMAHIHKKKVEGAAQGILEYSTMQSSEGKCLLEIRPKTGKYHQIRVQLGNLGCPIVGDGKYGSKVRPNEEEIYLHAWKIEFWDPASGKLKSYETAVPAFSTNL
ncbi:MAG: RNA pseudouridine synthase [Saprospiraceae bacterium]|nr:RNA pseudouridine synthase [Saprospiraceae bacterium]